MKFYGFGLNFVGALQLLFIAFKLADIIDWTWLWVLSPFWLPTVTFSVALLAAFIVTFLCNTIWLWLKNREIAKGKRQ